MRARQPQQTRPLLNSKTRGQRERGRILENVRSCFRFPSSLATKISRARTLGSFVIFKEHHIEQVSGQIGHNFGFQLFGHRLRQNRLLSATKSNNYGLWGVLSAYECTRKTSPTSSTNGPFLTDQFSVFFVAISRPNNYKYTRVSL